MGKHTKEPWVLFEVGDRHVHFCPASEAEKTSILTVTEEDGVSFAAVYNDDDARRIVACVNACRNLSNDELEQKGIVTSISARFLAAERSRDELLAALELMVAIHDEPSGFSGKYGKALDDAIQAQEEKIDERLLMARTAIAKAKGGAA
ncbi:hypothetical protein ACV1CV_06915 [Aeromonas veronii]